MNNLKYYISIISITLMVSFIQVTVLQAQGFQWVKVLEENEGEVRIKKILTTSSGNSVIVCGQFRGANVDFDPGPGTFLKSSVANSPDIYIARYTTSGALVNVITIGGSFNEVIKDFTIDINNDIVIVGHFKGSNIDFNPGIGIQNLSSSSGDYEDIFVAKYSLLLQMVFAHSIGNGALNYVTGVATDASRNIYITGRYSLNTRTNETPDFNVLSSSVTRPPGGYNGDAYIAKYNTAFGFRWVKSIGDAPGYDALRQESHGINIDAENNIIIHGKFDGPTDFDPGPNLNLVNLYYYSFIAKYDISGNFIWVSTIVDISHLTTDPQSNIIYIGRNSLDNLSFALIKKNKTGLNLWSIPVNTSSNRPYINSLVVDPASNIYISGNIKNDWDFDPGSGVVKIFKDKAEDFFSGFIAKYKSNRDLMWVFGNETGSFIDLHTDKLGNLYVSGYGNSGVLTDYDPGINNTKSPSGRSIIKYSQCFPAPAPLVEGNTSVCFGGSTTLSVANSQLFESSNWKWYSGPCGGTLIGTGTSVTINPTIPATYSVRAEGGCNDPNQCTSFFINVSSNVVPTINILPWTRPSDEKCFDEEVEYKASILYGGSSPQYQWKLNNVNVGSNSDKLKLNFREGDKIKCVLTSNATCATQTTVISNERTVVVSPRPATPDITQSGDTLFSSYPTGNQWYEEGIMLSGENRNYYVLDLSYGTFPKTYSVVYTDSKGCSREGKYRVYGPTSINQSTKESIATIYPNPAHNTLFIDPVLPLTLTYELWNIHGQLMLRGTNNGTLESLSLSEFANGFYILKIIQEEKSVIYKLIKQ